ncbi:MAG: tRNA (adenosine(37)-N6)-dimethylallyltransferase MiaA [Candidatus Kaiserbacteria bacterium]|nr:tRNA (adenosine(37)-N6)-dimethylallyltransferase MiaA [Candidatus Kaiserbacteria bacterium]
MIIPPQWRLTTSVNQRLPARTDARDSKSHPFGSRDSNPSFGTVQHTRPPLLVIVGTTASGKSDLAVDVALRYSGEVISADSRQIYRSLDATTGKITKQEMRGVPHHMLDIVNPGEEYSAHQFADEAIPHIEAVYHRNALPIVAGGSGFYIDALLFTGTTAKVPANPAYRKTMEQKDIAELQQELKKKDGNAYDRIDIQNPRRLIRALEVIRELGIFPMQQRVRRYEYVMIGIKHSRPHIRERIAKRLDDRFDAMTEEIKTLLEQGIDATWFDRMGLECRHITAMLTQHILPEETKANLLSAIFAYAKRQESWLRRYPETNWYQEHQMHQLYRNLDLLYKQ